MKISGAQDAALKLELQIFDYIRKQICEHMSQLQSVALGYKLLDAYLSLAQVARENHYVRPLIS